MVDRFHLVQNLRQALEAFLLAPPLGASGGRGWYSDGAHAGRWSYPGQAYVSRTALAPKPAPQEAAARPPRHARWVAIYEALHKLHAQGTPITTMARQLGISRPTVYAYLRRDTPPRPRRLQRPPSARVLTPYLPTDLPLAGERRR